METELVRSIGRLEGKVDEIKDLLGTHFKDDKEQFATLHKKVDGLKNKWAFAAGVTAVITFLLSNSSLITGIVGMLPK
jgi:nucleoside-triphosphatase THEP1